MSRGVARGCALALLVGALGAEPALGQAETCSGERVTISHRDPGVGLRITGTPRRDVILGGPLGEIISGGGGEDVICGGKGGDVIDGGAERDELYGQDGSDRFTSSAPDANLAVDIVVGGTRDKDRAMYTTSPVGVRVNEATHVVQADGERRRGGIQGIEVLVGSAHDDALIGDNKEDEISGFHGNDFIDGRGDRDNLSGNDGIDRVSYESAREAVRIDLAAQRATFASAGEGDPDQVKGFEVAIGSRFDDRLLGRNDANDHLFGGPGDDVMKGLGGDDILEGAGGDDSMHPGPGDDHVDGGANDRVTSAGEHGDLVSYFDDELDPGARQFEADLTTSQFGHPPYAAGVGDDSLVGIESVRGVRGKTNNIHGDDGPNVLIGGGRIDLLVGRGGNDLIFGLGTGDALHGDAGDDLLDGGRPEGENDDDGLNGGDGNDTCINGPELSSSGCEDFSR